MDKTMLSTMKKNTDTRGNTTTVFLLSVADLN